MKIVVCGKGGSGKSTLAAMVAMAMDRKGYNVLLIDADESNYGLHRLLGMEPPQPVLDSLGGKKGFRQKTAANFPPGTDELPFKPGMGLADLPEKIIARRNAIRLLVVGKIHQPGEGCACPMGALSKLILSRLNLADKDIVIIDTTAGVEHFGRGIDSDCDLILAVVDPCHESFVLAAKIQTMAQQAGIAMFLVLNKADDHLKAAMLQRLTPEKVVAVIPLNPNLFEIGFNGRALEAPLGETDPICRLIADLIAKRKASGYERASSHFQIFAKRED